MVVDQLNDWFERVYYMDMEAIDNAFPLLSEGSSRRIYAVSDNLVIKIATSRDGVRQCRTENRVYKRCGSRLREYLCPVVWYRQGMVAMARAKPLVDNENMRGDPPINPAMVGEPHTVIKDLRKLSRKMDLLYEDLISATSWGYLNDELVLIDYGCED